MSKKVFYWSPFFSNIATTKAVLNSAISIKKYSNDYYEPFIIDVFGEWDEYKNIIELYKINLIKLNLDDHFKERIIHGFLKSRYYQIKIFILSFIPLLRLLRSEKPEVMILHLVTALPLIINFVFKNNIKTILRISGYPKLNFIRKYYWNIVLRRVDSITAPTIDTCEYLKKKFKDLPVSHLKDPVINLKDIKYTTKKTSKKNSKYIAIGRLTKQKNFMFLIRCFSDILKKYPNSELYIFGEGEDHYKLNKFIQKNNLQKNITLMGYKSNIFEYLRDCDAFLLSSLWEDPGFVLIEAAYSNTTIISSDCDNGPKEILNYGKNGFLFRSNNKKDFLNTFDKFKNSTEKDIFRKKVNAKKMSKNYSLLNHYLKLNKILHE